MTESARKDLSEAMGSRNIAFLLGSGCSSLVKGVRQVGIPTMGPLAQEFTAAKGKARDGLFVTKTEKRFLRDSLGIDESVANLYERFYRKLVFRDRSLPRPWQSMQHAKVTDLFRLYAREVRN